MKAIILCAGEGTRMRPITYQKPKPLLVVGGRTLLENTLQYLRDADIDDITLVTGYKAEDFHPYAQKYNLTLVHSSEFASKNNHSSLQLVKDMLDDSLIIDGDLYFHRNIFTQIKPDRSQFITQKTEKVPEWECIVDEDNRLLRVKKDSLNGYSLSGVAYWQGEGARLLAAELDRCQPDEYWEDAALRVLTQAPVYMTPCPKFQTELDILYQAYTSHLIGPDEIAIQCSDAGHVERLKGLTNYTYHIMFQGRPTVLRVPGAGTERLIDREFERRLIESVPESITPPSVFYAGGIKTMPFLEGHDVLTRDKVTMYFPQLCDVLRTLHMLPVPSDESVGFSCTKELSKYESLARMAFLTEEERQRVLGFAERMDADAKVLCHRDLLCENILVKGDSLKIIDFEYADYTTKYWDIASFITESRMPFDAQKDFAAQYGGLDFQRVLEAVIVVEYIWSLWGFAMNYMDYGRKRMCALDAELEQFASLYG